MATAQAALNGSAVISASTAPTAGNVNTYNATSGALTPTLPALSGLTVGAILILEKDTLDTSSNTITFTRNGSDTFQDLTTSVVLRGTGEQLLLQVVQPSATKYWKVIGRSYAVGAVPNAAIQQAGINNFNTAVQSQSVVSATAYYVTSSGLTMPASALTGMTANRTCFEWRVAMAKTAAGTGTFQLIIYRGTNGSTSDTADVTQTLGTQTAVVDDLLVDVKLIVTTTGATGAYFWSMTPVNSASAIGTPAGFGITRGTTSAWQTGTVSSVAMNTASLIFGLGFKATTGTPTITVPMVQARAWNMN